ncbi:MAG: cation:proton antiporter [Parachlamydia sp.]|nr:cation:proton antiporter [Parachlamydia sp.]
MLTLGFGLASLLGYVTSRLKLSPILGYLIAGYVIGPYSPGVTVDVKVAEQLAEIGVILMMFGVGLHFEWKDLVKTKSIAIPGAIFQTLITMICSTFFIYSIGWTIVTGIIIGLSIGVASTVVMVRILTDHNLFHTTEGHIAVGWTIVEDLLTVVALLAVPILATSLKDGMSLQQILIAITGMVLKFLILIAFMFTIGRAIVTYVLFMVARLRSHELFTLTVLALTFIIATSSTLIFGTSLALGAFIAGLVIGQTHARHQASLNALPIQDAFVAIFFLSVGMLFNPPAIRDHPLLFFGILGIILLIKPIAAFLITIALRYPVKAALTIAIALAQIGEFSFILAEQAMKLDILPEAGYDMIVASAIVSIALNPILFTWIDDALVYFEMKRFLSPVAQKLAKIHTSNAIVIGHGPIGKQVVKTLEDMDVTPVVVDLNIETVTRLNEQQRQAIYGEASHPHILENAQIDTAKLLVITIPDEYAAIRIIKIAKLLRPDLPILVRVNFTSLSHAVKQLGVEIVCSEEETKKAFIQALHQMQKKFNA